jgi:hypothetical protein
MVYRLNVARSCLYNIPAFVQFGYWSAAGCGEAWLNLELIVDSWCYNGKFEIAADGRIIFSWACWELIY